METIKEELTIEQKLKCLREKTPKLERYLGIIALRPLFYSQEEMDDHITLNEYRKLDIVLDLMQSKDKLDPELNKKYKEHLDKEIPSYLEDTHKIEHITLFYYLIGLRAIEDYFYCVMRLNFLYYLHLKEKPEFSKDLKKIIDILDADNPEDLKEIVEKNLNVIDKNNIYAFVTRYTNEKVKERCLAYINNDKKNYSFNTFAEYLDFTNYLIDNELDRATTTQVAVSYINDKINELIKKYNLTIKEEALEKYVKELVESRKNNLIASYSEYLKDNNKKPSKNTTLDLIHKEYVKKHPKTLSKLAPKQHDNIKDISDEWLRICTNKHALDYLNARDKIKTYQDTDVERFTNRLKELKKELKKKPNNKKLQEQIESTEEDIKEATKNREELKASIEELDASIRILQEQYKNAETEEDKKEYLKFIKSKTKEKKEKEKNYNARGITKQVSLIPELNKLKVNNDTIELIINYDDFSLQNYNRESQRVLLYIQDQILKKNIEDYENPTIKDKTIIMDLEGYAEQTGRKATSYRSFKSNVFQSVDGLFKEYIKIIKYDKVSDIKIDTELRAIQRTDKITYKGKATIRIVVTDDFLKLTLGNKSRQYALIPILLNKLGGNGNPTEERARELGLYFHTRQRFNIKAKDSNKNKLDTTKKYDMKTLVDLLVNKGLISYNTYKTRYDRVIGYMKEALNILEDTKIFTIETMAFSNYEGDEERNIEGMVGMAKGRIKQAFESENVEVTINIYNDAYDELLKNKNSGRKPKKASKKTKEVTK